MRAANEGLGVCTCICNVIKLIASDEDPLHHLPIPLTLIDKSFKCVLTSTHISHIFPKSYWKPFHHNKESTAYIFNLLDVPQISESTTCYLQLWRPAR